MHLCLCLWSAHVCCQAREKPIIVAEHAVAVACRKASAVAPVCKTAGKCSQLDRHEARKAQALLKFDMHARHQCCGICCHMPHLPVWVYDCRASFLTSSHSVQRVGQANESMTQLMAKLNINVMGELKRQRNVSAVAYFFSAASLEQDSTGNGAARALVPGSRSHNQARVCAYML